MKSRGDNIVKTSIALALVLAILIAPISMSQRPVIEKKGTPDGWSDDVNLSQNQLNSNQPAIATNQNNIHVVWFYNPGPTRDIVYKKSIDGGRTWGSMITLDNSTLLDWNPDIGISGNNIHVVWENDLSPKGVYYRNSIDNGDTWNTMKRLNPTDKPAGNPNVFVNNSNVHVAWHDWRAGIGGLNGQVFYRRSVDGGIIWDNGQGVDADRQITFSPSTIGHVDIAGQGSNLSVIWYDERNGDFQVYWMISKDNGYTWEDGLGNVNTDRQISTSSNTCIDPSIAMDGSNISIVWSEQSWPGPTYCLYYRNSSDMGATWGNIQLLTGPTPLSSWPDISIYKNNIHVVWHDRRDDGTHNEIYYKNSTDGGISWGSDMRLTFNNTEWSECPKIAVQNDTRHIVWDNWYGSNLRDVFYKRYPDFPPDPTYNISLGQGWNLVSLPLEQHDESIDQALSSIAGKWDHIRTYDPLTGTWESNSTYVPYQLNDISAINHKQGFWINITEPGGTILTCSGYDPPSTTISLFAGWNLVGYPSLANETVANALWGTGADKVMVCDTSEPYHIKDVGPTYVMKPGEGYWIHVPADSTWIVNW